MKVCERVMTFGTRNGLVGILCRPEEEALRAAMVIPNAGNLPRTGPHRLPVEMARSLALRGIATLRFDVHGLGDSTEASGDADPGRQAALDVMEALDALTSIDRSIARRAVLGLCAGADTALAAAGRDMAVTHAILLDPPLYEAATPARSAPWNPGRLMDRRRRQRSLRPAVTPNHVSDLPGFGVQRTPLPGEEFASELESLARRGTRVLVRYSSTVGKGLTGPTQVLDSLSGYQFSGRLTIDVDHTTDHAYTEQTARIRLFARVTRWLLAEHAPGS